jgi:hypothetical protein
MDDDFKTIGEKSLWQEIQTFVYRETETYMLKKVDDLCMAAIEELLDIYVLAAEALQRVAARVLVAL